jgi:gentisate 1,2-dioxygenase
MLMPGEVAAMHRHSYSGLRFMISGSGAHMVVEGQRIAMEVGDLVLTPNWSWHDHEGGGEPTVWLDGFDFPLVHALRPTFFEGRAHPQEITVPAGATMNAHTAGVMVPPRRRQQPARPFSLLSVYSFGAAHEALSSLRRDDDVNPCDGRMIEYVNPTTGGHVLATIAAHLQLLEPGEATRAHRHTWSTVYHCVSGSGHCVVNGHRFEWEEKDVWVVPNWAWHEHHADPGSEAVLFSYSDLPSLEPFGFAREEEYSSGDGHQELVD